MVQIGNKIVYHLRLIIRTSYVPICTDHFDGHPLSSVHRYNSRTGHSQWEQPPELVMSPTAHRQLSSKDPSTITKLKEVGASGRTTLDASPS